MSYTAETLEARKDCYLALLAIRRKVCDPEADHIDKQTMKVAGIEQFFMDISQDSDCKPLFFTPYQHKYDGLDKSAYSYPTYRPASDNYFNVGGLHVYMQNCMSQSLETQPSGVRYQSWGRFNFGELFECTRHRWKVSFTGVALPTDGQDERLPHMKCVLESDVIGDDRLLRSELISIINVMAGRLSTKSLRPHVVAPVLLFSAMGPQHLRVLEAYFNGEKLIVRHTKLYDMKEYNVATIDLFIRWWLGYPSGETRTITKILP